MSSAEPQTIGRYEVRGVLGRGAMGIVYRARSVDVGHFVALKMATQVSDSHLAALRREVHALGGIRHRGVVRVVDEGVHDGLPWFAMELLEGRTLRDWLNEIWLGNESRLAGGGRLEGSLELFARICEPLTHIHEHAIVHRDLKPENVYIETDGSPVLVDFGLFAHFASSHSREVLDAAPGFAGTISYIAPEQIHGELVDARADLYALGCLLYEGITGRPPFVGGGTRDVLQRHLREKPSPPSARVDGVPPWLDELVLLLLEKAPRDRLGYADVVADKIASGLGRSFPRTDRGASRPYLYRPALVGRDAALAELERSIGAGVDGKGSVILLVGESGIGKTRLAIEAATVAAERGMQVVIGECTPIGSDGQRTWAAGGPLHPFRSFFSAIADRCRGRGRSETDQILGARGRILVAYEPTFAELPGQSEYPLPPEVSPEAAIERLQEAVVGTIQAYSQVGGPVLLILDDLQWADEFSLRVLTALCAGGLENIPLVIVGTVRREEIEDPLREIVERPRTQVIELERLGPESVLRMVGDMLAMPSAPKGFVDRLCSDTEGNPFFVSEYLLAAVGEGILDRDPSGRWHVRSGAEQSRISIPHALQDLVRLRVERLPPAARRLVEVASVLGQSFEEELLMQSAPLSPTEAMGAMQELLRRRLVERSDRGILSFTHGKIREVTYDAIPAAMRSRDHERVAIAIESFFRDSLAPHSSALAHHWMRVADTMLGDKNRAVKAIEWLERAGEQAAQSHADQETLRLFGEILRLEAREAGTLPAAVTGRRAHWERRLGEAYFRLGRVVEARNRLERALDVLDERVPVGHTRVVVGLMGQAARQLLHRLLPALFLGRARATARERALEAATIYEQLGLIQFINLETLSASFTNLRALNLAETCGPSPALAGSSALAGLSLGVLLGSRVADFYFGQGLRSAAAVDDRYGRARVLYTRAFVLSGLARWDEAMQALTEARSTFVEIGDTRWRDTAMISMGVVEHTRGRYRQSLGFFEKAVASTRERGDVQASVWATIGYAAAELGTGNVERALGALGEVEELLGGGDFRVTDRGTEINFLANLVPALFRSGDVEQALRMATRATSLIHESALLMFYVLSGYANVTEVFLRIWELRQSSADQAQLPRLARGALGDLEHFARFFPIAQPDRWLWRGLFEWLRGKHTRAHAAWRRGVTWGERLAMLRPLGMIHLEIGRHLPAADPERDRHLQRAAELFAGGEMSYELGLARAAVDG